ncbi:Rpr2-domain-containing protein [Xylariaceae sp. FL0662B]|nr:Rpr2-domain-containing protein [Xylariaceae sp. FL0662B]
MAKSKTSGSVPNRPIYSRISYLYQAATYLETHSEPEGSAGPVRDLKIGNESQDEQALSTIRAKRALSRRLLTDLRASSLKTQIRLSPALKHTICKYCDSLLIEGETSSSVVENKSKGAKKPWADVLAIKCNTCGGVRRFPVQAARQNRRPVRENETKNQAERQNQGVDNIAMEGN